ncbi:DUF2007 domain-containing protein [Leptobacterium sp. I13]|uniref:DUF2007 domain-containing protein n=1 Tax=Leptobacterium meishanense TaxID=3128904 RepID=UPI0030EE42A0
MNNFVVVTTYTYPSEYVVLKSILEEEEIPYVFENETMVTISPFYSNALGGIKLKVHKNDLDKVRSIIERLNNKDSFLHIV